MLLVGGVSGDPLTALQALSAINCDEALLSRALGGVSKAQAMALASRYSEKYSADLPRRISERTGGDYCRALVTWLTVPDPTRGLETALVQEGGHSTAQCIANVKVRECDGYGGRGHGVCLSDL